MITTCQSDMCHNSDLMAINLRDGQIETVLFRTLSFLCSVTTYSTLHILLLLLLIIGSYFGPYLYSDETLTLTLTHDANPNPNPTLTL